MNIVTLYEHSDLAMRKSLDRYLSQLSKNGDTRIWNDEQVLPGEDADAVLREQLKNADLVLLLVSQDFLASPTSYAHATTALQLCRGNPEKKMVNVLLRPNSIEDTPFKEFPQLPVQDVCITQYKDPEQGYWDTYQVLKKIINPRHRYKKRPKIAALQATMLASAILLLWSLFVLLLPVIHPQEGLRIVPTPFLGDADTVMYYKIFKLDKSAQEGVVLGFMILSSDSVKLGKAKPVWATLEKTGDESWSKNQAYTVDLTENQENENAEYYSQCVYADFNKNDEGEYRFIVEFDKPLNKQRLTDFSKKSFCGHSPCGLSKSNCENATYFSFLHYFYFPGIRFSAIILAFVFITLLLLAIFTTNKISSYGKSDNQSYQSQKAKSA